MIVTFKNKKPDELRKELKELSDYKDLGVYIGFSLIDGIELSENVEEISIQNSVVNSFEGIENSNVKLITITDSTVNLKGLRKLKNVEQFVMKNTELTSSLMDLPEKVGWRLVLRDLELDDFETSLLPNDELRIDLRYSNIKTLKGLQKAHSVIIKPDLDTLYQTILDIDDYEIFRQIKFSRYAVESEYEMKEEEYQNLFKLKEYPKVLRWYLDYVAINNYFLKNTVKRKLNLIVD